MQIVSLFTITLHPWVLKCLWGVVALRILIPIQFQIGLGWLNRLSEWLEHARQDSDFSLTYLVIGIWLVGAVTLVLIFFVRNLRFGEMLKKIVRFMEKGMASGFIL